MSHVNNKTLIMDSPSIKIYGEKEFWLNGLIKESNLSSLIPFYLDVLTNINNLNKNEKIKKIFSNNEYEFYIDKNNNICLSSISDSKQIKGFFDTQPFKLLPKEHFWVSGLKRNFELSALIQLYLHVMNNFETLTQCVKEITIGSSTIVFQVDEKNNINLITGWIGSRKKTK